MNSRRERAPFPDFIAIGPQRTATTWLHLRLAGRVNFPQGVNEPQFFDKHYHKGIEWYLSHFDAADPGRIMGDITPTYFHSPEASQRIKQWIPECKIICSLRDPVKRLYSLYRNMRGYGVTSVSFEEALSRHAFMLDSGRYAHHLARWFETFGRERTLVLVNDDLLREPQRYIDDVCKFLAIPQFTLDPTELMPPEHETPARIPAISRFVWRGANFLRSHRLYSVVKAGRQLGLRKLFVGGGQDLPPIDRHTSQNLRQQLMPEVEALERLIGRDLSAWKHDG